MKEAVEKTAALARLRFDSEELSRFVPQFTQILEYFRQLETVDVASVEPTYHPGREADQGTPLREDRELPSLSQEEALSGAPESGEGHFRVPKVIE